MLPLYALGVMLGFSLSQTGMFRLMGKIKHLKPGEILHTLVTEVHFERHTSWKQAINALGAVLTFTVFLILLITKFVDGAWIVAVLIPFMVIMFFTINHHYENVSEALSTQGMAAEQEKGVADVVIVPIADVHRGTLLALQYASRISRDVRALTIITSEEQRNRLESKWKRFSKVTDDIQLIAIDYDFRDILDPIVDYIKHTNSVEFKDNLTTIVVPEFIPGSRWASWLHNQTAYRLRARLREYKDIVIIDVPFHIDKIEKIRSRKHVHKEQIKPVITKSELIEDNGSMPDTHQHDNSGDEIQGMNTKNPD
jgi:hypothetical protein